ncbi:MAG: hypothetical protein FJW40_27465 [Acidobacteria bacterium]|nr:hypothetical protein [Acidobacteriota bacterium]
MGACSNWVPWAACRTRSRASFRALRLVFPGTGLHFKSLEPEQAREGDVDLIDAGAGLAAEPMDPWRTSGWKPRVLVMRRSSK